jgi:ABC-type multidrug transport system fused ATPase/permease subunit
MFAAVDFGVCTPGFFGIAAGLLDYVLAVEPALQMTAAKFSFFVLLVTRTLPSLLDFDFMMRKLRRSLRARSCDFASCQGTHLRCAALAPPESVFGSTVVRASLYSKEKDEPKPAISYASSDSLNARFFNRILEPHS